MWIKVSETSFTIIVQRDLIHSPACSPHPSYNNQMVDVDHTDSWNAFFSTTASTNFII